MDDEDRSFDYKLVPWLSWHQWNFVRESLFSSSPDSITAALRRISAWRSRGCLPIVIEVTASIVEIQQKDPFFKEGPINDALNSEEMLAMLYCMAITRLVNGVVEKTRKKTEVSIAEAADAIGIPRMLIDIRHEGSHRDLPSLQLVRAASVKAIDWLKSYYWEPQKNAIPFQRDEIANVRKEIKSKLRELAFHLSNNQAQQSGSLPMRGRRVKQPELLCGRNKIFTHITGKLQACKSGGSKKQIKKTLRIVVQLYSCYPYEVVAVLVEFLLKADFSDDRDVDPSDNSQVVHRHVSMTGATDIWKLVISRFSTKEPELLLTMLRAVLERIGTLEAMRSEIGQEHLIPLQNKEKICQIEYLSSLVEWLIGNYKKVKHFPCGMGSGLEIHGSSEVGDVQKLTLAELLRMCLLVSPGNNHLAGSALQLAQMIGNSSMVEGLKMLSQLSLPSFDFADETASCTSVEYILLQHEKSISQAAEKLEFLKRRRTKDKTINSVVSNNDKEKKEKTWRRSKFWNPCPIGMLPCGLGSAGILPILDRAIDMPEVQQFSESRLSWELNRCSGKRDASCDVESLENSNVFKKAREIVEGDWVDDRASSLEPFKDQLMIDGAWKKVGEEELLAIESAVRILV